MGQKLSLAPILINISSVVCTV